jgi:hypothetical protein
MHWGYGFSGPGSADDLSLGIGVLPLLFLLITAVLWHRAGKPRPAALPVVAIAGVLLVGALYMMTAYSMPLWDLVPLLHPLQFPWRWLALASFAAAFLMATPFLFVEDERLGRHLMIGLIAVLLVVSLRHAAPATYWDADAAAFTSSNIRAMGIVASAREYEPIDVTSFPAQRPAIHGLAVVSGRAEVSDIREKPQHRSYHIRADELSTLRTGLFYFPGWRITANDKSIPVQVIEGDGVMQFELPAGDYDVDIDFGETPLRSLAKWLTVLSVVVLIAGGRGAALLRRQVLARSKGQRAATAARTRN